MQSASNKKTPWRKMKSVSLLRFLIWIRREEEEVGCKEPIICQSLIHDSLLFALFLLEWRVQRGDAEKRRRQRNRTVEGHRTRQRTRGCCYFLHPCLSAVCLRLRAGWRCRCYLSRCCFSTGFLGVTENRTTGCVRSAWSHPSSNKNPLGRAARWFEVGLVVQHNKGCKALPREETVTQ